MRKQRSLIALKFEIMKKCLLLLALALMGLTFAGGHQCLSPRALPDWEKLEFDFDGENLSFENCGQPKDDGAADWRIIAVGRSDAATCYGIRISDYNFITSQCMEVAKDFITEESSVNAFTGICYDQKVGTIDNAVDCTAEGIGKKYKVVKVAEIGKTQLHLWQLEWHNYSESSMCLYNRNTAQPPGYEGSIYKIYDRKENFTGDFLVAEIGGRLMLRGFFNAPVADGRFFNYTDVAPFIKQIIANSHDMYLMPDVPAHAKKKTDFTGETVLNFDKCSPTANKIARRRNMRQVNIRQVNTATDFVFNGNGTSGSDHPWHASVSFRSNRNFNLSGDKYDICGASIISEQVVLTAAHCVMFAYNMKYTAGNVEIMLGMHNSTEDVNSSRSQSRYARSITIHPKYDSGTNDYDVALIVLESKINITEYVSPICLWREDYDMDIIKNESSLVYGWGNTNNSKILPELLQYGELTVYSYRDCYLREKTFFRKTLRPGFNFCAGTNTGVSACNGDSGGGLVLQRNSTWFLRGVLSRGIDKQIRLAESGDTLNLCNEKYPALFVDLASVIDWILENLRDPLK